MTQTFIVTTPASNGGAVCAAANGTTITVSCNTNACRMFVYACVFARVFHALYVKQMGGARPR